MTSETGNHCWQNGNVRNAGQISPGICEKVCVQENCKILETTNDNQCEKSCIHVDSGLEIGHVKWDDFAVIKQTLEDICDKISIQECSDVNSNVTGGTQVDSGCIAVAENISSAKMEVTVNGMASHENDILASTKNDVMEDNHEIVTKVETEMYSNEQCSNAITAENCGNCNTLRKDHVKSEATCVCSGTSEQLSDIMAVQNCDNILEIMDQKRIKGEVQFDGCDSHLRTEGDQNVFVSPESGTEQSCGHRHSCKDKEVVTGSIIPAKVESTSPAFCLGTSKQEDCIESDSLISNNFVNEPQETDGRLVNICNLNEDMVTKTNEGTCIMIGDELVSNSQLYNESGAPNERNIPKEQRQAPVINKQSVAASEVGTPHDDLLYVMSVVEEDMRDMGITTVNRAPESQLQLTNDLSNKHLDSENWENGNNVELSSKDRRDWSEDDSTSSSSESSSDDSDSESEEDVITKRTKMAEADKKFVASPPKTKHELCLSDLPMVEHLDIVVDESVELAPLGEIGSILLEDALVIIKSFENVPALDSDSILFLEDRSSFGKVFEIFGQVQSPHYCVRFNNENEIRSTNVEIGQTVYFAPDTEDLTNFVFLSQLKSNKGSDASWKYDQEPPIEVVEFSDDEAESRAKAAKKMANQRNKRNEVHRQEQGLMDVATRSKKQRPSGPNIRHHPTSTSSRPKLEQQFPRQSCSHPQAPTLRFPPKLQIRPREPPPRFIDQRVPLHPPPMGPPLHQIQPQFHCPPQFTEFSNRPPPRNQIMVQGLAPFVRPQSHGGPWLPPPQTNEMWRQPFQMFSAPLPPPPPQQDIPLPNNQLPPQNWPGPIGWDLNIYVHNLGRPERMLFHH